MALWPNVSLEQIGWFPSLVVSHAGYMSVQQLVQRNLAFFGNDTIEETASWPEGAFGSPSCILPPIVSGGMSSSNELTDIEFSALANILAGGPVEGSTTATFSGTGALAINVTLNANGTITFSQTGGMALTVGMAADGSLTFSGTGALAMIVPAAGSASFAVSSVADLRSRLSLSGDITPFTELSPQNLATAVWAAVAADNRDPNSMGEFVQKLLTVAKFLGLK
jgi:hypothetical protein